MSRYPDHGSPVRKARTEARQKMPCPECGSRGEPALRTPPPYSAAWLEDQSTYFGCPDCGSMLARLEGSAAARPSDVPEDRLPDPEDLLDRRILPAISEIAAEHGLLARYVEVAGGKESSRVIRLTWQGKTWIDLVVRKGFRPRRRGGRRGGPVQR